MKQGDEFLLEAGNDPGIQSNLRLPEYSVSAAGVNFRRLDK
jgi:hypothetical protein